MKTEAEIRDEIDKTKKTKENYRREYEANKITKSLAIRTTIDCTATISALKWVLGENDRYD